MTTKHLYLTLALVGLIVPYYFLISFVLSHGLDGSAFLRQLFGTPISSFFATDLLISSVVFVGFLLRESRRYSIAHWWAYLVALATVGLSFALPLFLYARERGRETEARSIRGSVA
jgi:hypothetical protein